MRRLALFPLLAVLLAGCGTTVPGGGRTVTSATPQAVIGTVPTSSGPKGDPQKGRVLYNANGCGACHTYTPAGSNGKVGPDLDHLALDAKKANRGTLDQYTRSSIVAPGAYIVPGYPNAMPPTYGAKLSAVQVSDLVAFLTQGS